MRAARVQGIEHVERHADGFRDAERGGDDDGAGGRERGAVGFGDRIEHGDRERSAVGVERAPMPSG